MGEIYLYYSDGREERQVITFQNGESRHYTDKAGYADGLPPGSKAVQYILIAIICSLLAGLLFYIKRKTEK